MSTTITMRNTKQQIFDALVAEKAISASYKSLAKADVRQHEEAQLPQGTFAVFGANTISVWSDAISATQHAKDLEVRHPQGVFSVRSGHFTLSATKHSVHQPAGTTTKLVYTTQVA